MTTTFFKALKLSVTILLFFGSLQVKAQAPANDEICNAIELTAGTSCTYQQFTTANATTSTGMDNPTCGAFNGRDVWFKFSVPCTGGFKLDTDIGQITDAAMAIYTGDCNDPVLFDCDDDASANGLMPMLQNGSFAPGKRVYVRVWSRSNAQVGTFKICLQTIPPPPVGQTCNSAAPFCSSTNYTFPSVTGFPNPNGGGIYGCLNTIPNPNYYYFQVNQSGAIKIHMTQTSTSGTPIDLDFVLWGPFSSPNGMCNQVTAANIVDCSYSPAAVEDADIPNAQVGQYYLMLITNFNGSPGTFSFSQTGGTGGTNCGIVCDLAASNNGPVCPGQTVDLSSNATNGQNWVWTGPDCFTYYGQNAPDVTVPSTPGTYVYTITTTDASGNHCNDTTRVVVANTLTGQATPTNESCPGANDGTITVSVPSSGSYTLNPGNVVQTNPVFSNLAPGTYSINFNAGCTGVINNIVVGPGTNTLSGTATTTPTNCPGAVNGGSLTIVPSSPGSYTYVLSPGGVSQTSPTFNGLAPGTYSVTATTANNCTFTVSNIVIADGPAPSGTANVTPPSCLGANNGSVTITPSITTGSFSYTITPGGAGAQASPIFSNLAAGTYTIAATSPSGCTFNVPNVVVPPGPPITGTATTTGATCAGANNGSITVAPGVADSYTYVLTPGGVSHSSPNFPNLAGGTYSVTATNALGCSFTVGNIVVDPGSVISGTATTVATTCNGATDGSLKVTPAIAGAYNYTLTPGGATNTTGIFNNLNSGTYSVLYTNNTGCGGQVDNIVVASGPAISATSSTTPTSCFGAINGSLTVTPSAAGSYTFSITPGGTSNTTGVFNNLPADTYSVTYINNLGCGSYADAIVVASGAALTSTATTVATSCLGATDGSLAVTPGTPDNYQYTLVETGATNSTGTFSNLAPGTYTVNFLNALGCGGQKANIVVAAGAELTGTAATTNSTCLGATDGAITVTPATSGTYQFTLVETGATNATGIFSSLSPGTFSVTFQNALGCSKTLSNIVVSAGPALVVNKQTQATSCLGATDGTIEMQPQTSGNYTYRLLPSGTPTTNAMFSNLAAGTYSISFVNQLGCADTVDNIVVAPGSQINIANSTQATSCAGVNNGSITMQPTNPGTYTYTLNPGNVVQSNAVFNNLAPGTYSITYENQFGCSNTTNNIVVAAGTTITSNVSPQNPPCANINNGSIKIVTNSTATPATFLLQQTGESLGGNEATFNNLSPNIDYVVKTTDAVGCQRTDTIRLSTNPALTITQSAKLMPLCFGGADGSMDFAAGGGVPAYQYSIDNGVNYQASSRFTNLQTNNYHIRIKDNLGCTKDTTIFLDQPASAVSATAANTLVATCSGNDGEITITANGGTVPYQYSIDNGATYNANNVLVAPSTGNFNIVVKDNNGCSANASTLVTYTNNLVVDLGMDTTICQEDTITIVSTITGLPTNYNWQSNYHILNPTEKDAKVYPFDTTTYKLIITQGPCTAEDEIVVNVKWKPLPYAGKDTVVCLNQPIFLSGSATHTSGAVTYHWSDTTGLADPNAAATLLTPPVDSFFNAIKTLTVKDTYGCDFAVTDEVKISVQPPVPAFAGRDTIGVLGVPHTLMGSGGTQYVWSPANLLDNPFVAHPQATITQDTRFFVQVTTEYGCVGYDTVMVKVYDGPTYYVPNAFSPNGDGLNDVFRPIPVGISNTEFFRVFNRWGEMVFSTSEWLKGWDGTFKGKKVPLGVYTWVIKGIDRYGKKVDMRGTVMVVQ